ncbi:hypothetical protein [Cystobacter fuscus]|uniref:hypothetical protein n=1 Tax=Cystobacter fuscus TaxID=43 RepID=UPI002B2B33F8|nr:hypothetical protein F0U63_14030 [Cystobacter fuscus]
MKTFLPLLLGVALLTLPGRADACGPDYREPFFVHSTHPDRPFSTYAEGHLGILQPTYRAMYLAYAYRTMLGVPTTPREQQALLEGWSREQGDSGSLREVNDPESPTLRAWRQARAELPQETPSTPEVLEADSRDYASYVRINEDALKHAAETARTLARLWKKRPALLREWLRAQDVVFGACAPLPDREEGLDEGLTPAERSRRAAERAYQEAARLFYCGDFPAAAQAFQAIAASPDSPYRNMGLYLAARALVRQAMLARKDGEGSTQAMQEPSFQKPFREAEKLLGTVLANPKQREAHAPARRLLGFIRYRLAPEQRRCELYSLILEKGTGTALEAELIDFTHLFSPERTCPGLKGDAADLEVWLRTTWAPYEYTLPEKSPDKDYETALARWKKTSRLPWLVTALMKARPDSPGLAELLEDAGKVPASEPVGVTVAYYSGHLLRELGRADEARQRLARVTPEMTAEQVSTDNLLRRERLLLATSWDEAFRNLTRRVAGETGYDIGYSDAIPVPPSKRPIYFDTDARSVLGPVLTARRMLELARGDALPPGLRRQVGWAAFTKATVVGDDETLQAAARALAETEPTAREELLRIVGRPTPEDRRFDAQVLVMGLPLLSPFLEPGADRYWSADPKLNLTVDESRARNWWCAPPMPKEGSSPLAFVPEEERQAALAERKQLVEAGNSVSWFGRVAVEWAQAHPEDPRSPVALYRVVRASKRGCGGQNTKEATAAFRLLHQRYAKSDQAKRAPYVY